MFEFGFRLNSLACTFIFERMFTQILPGQNSGEPGGDSLAGTF